MAAEREQAQNFHSMELQVCAMSERNGAEVPHVVIVTIPCPGHTIPAAQLAKHLLDRNFAVTCFTTGANFETIERNLETHHQNTPIKFHSLINPHTEFTPPGRDITDNIAWMQRQSDAEMATRLEKSVEKLRISCIVSDVMVGWAQDVADKRSVPRYVLYTMPANALLFSFRCVLGEASRHPPGTWNSMEDAAHAFYAYMMRNAARLREAEAILVNTFEALEEGFLKVLRAEVLGRRDVQTQRILSIGPLIRSANHDHKHDTSSCPDIFQWLELQKPRSVLYVSFGSLLTVTETQVQELALGLERAGRPFVWVYRAPNSPQVLPEDEARFDGLPSGFLERVEGRGKLIHGWAPQEQILAHASIGAFMSHCGWNSSLEALWAGKPLIAWPLAVEQRLTAKYFGSELGIAVEVRKNDAGVVESAEVARAVSLVMDDEDVRSRFGRMHELARLALAEEGSSRENLNLFVGSLYSSPYPSN